MNHLLSNITPDELVSVSSAWVTAVFTILSLILAACVGFWAKYGSLIEGIVARLDRHGRQIDTLQINTQPPAARLPAGADKAAE